MRDCRTVHEYTPRNRSLSTSFDDVNEVDRYLTILLASWPLQPIICAVCLCNGGMIQPRIETLCVKIREYRKEMYRNENKRIFHRTYFCDWIWFSNRIEEKIKIDSGLRMYKVYKYFQFRLMRPNKFPSLTGYFPDRGHLSVTRRNEFKQRADWPTCRVMNRARFSLSRENKTCVYKRGIEKNGKRDPQSINVVPHDRADEHDWQNTRVNGQ